MNTDLGKGELMELGLTALMNPITTIEPIQLDGESGADQEVDSLLEKVAPPMFN